MEKRCISCSGFTLIELLVVVLIIGILAAVALPQYQIAVTKSRYATLKQLVQSIARAEEVYYLANGTYTPDFEALDVSMPGGKLASSTSSRYEYDWGHCTISSVVNYIYLCTDDKTGMYYQRYSNHATQRAGQALCGVFGPLDLASASAKVCQQETNATPGTTDDYSTWAYGY